MPFCETKSLRFSTFWNKETFLYVYLCNKQLSLLLYSSSDKESILALILFLCDIAEFILPPKEKR